MIIRRNAMVGLIFIFNLMASISIFCAHAIDEDHHSRREFGSKDSYDVILRGGQDFLNPHKLSLLYTPDEVNRNWLDTGSRRVTLYRNAPAGNHLFRLTPSSEGNSILRQNKSLFRQLERNFYLTVLFCTLCSATVIFIGRRIQRYSLDHMIELERVRRRIATDLHDDIGSGLSQIAIMTEIVAQRIHTGDVLVADSLNQIANTSRELVDSMSDIVWAVNPSCDNTENLTQRMRRFVSDILDGSDIRFQFHVSGTDLERNLEPDVRRQLFLVFKEGINNALRHSGCSSLEISIQIEQKRLIITMADNGKGFNPLNVIPGNGIRNMHQRMKEINGDLEMISRENQGTTILQLAPLLSSEPLWEKSLPMKWQKKRYPFAVSLKTILR